MIHTNIKDASKKNSEIKKNRWNGYNIMIIKDSSDALDQLNKVMMQRQIKRNMALNNDWRR